MSLTAKERLSDSPYVEKIIHGYTTSTGSSIRPSEIHWHMVFVKEHGNLHPLVVGPLTSAGVANWGAGGEILWIKFKLGTFMPNLAIKNFMDKEIAMPEAASQQSFWLNSSTWDVPSFENADTFVDQLVRDGALTYDPLVDAALQNQLPDMASRTVRHRFLRATGLTQSHIQQFERAQQAAALLKQGVPILDTVFEAGYFDQPHLTRSLKRFLGITPARQYASP